MRLSAFIAANLDSILVEWVAFARQQLPSAASMDENALLDHGKLILLEMSADMRRLQGEGERQAKSEGHSATASTSSSVPSKTHARQREQQGFAIEQMVAEYRALRATVMRLWIASPRGDEDDDLEDVIRFNEAVDQAIAESLNVFLVEVEKTRDLFLGMLGHDLRGPLSAIASCATIDSKTRSGGSTTSNIMLRSVAQMQALLDDLVEYTRNRLGKGLTISPAPLDLEKFVRETVGEIQAVSMGRVIDVKVEGNTEGKWDARRLHQALSNLVFNALKYGHPRTAVNVSVDGRGPDEVLLVVENSGKPIPPALLPKIFEPMVRAEGTNPHEDSGVAGANLGLGLFVVREVAVAHGGRVSVESDESRTRFELRLPRFTE